MTHASDRQVFISYARSDAAKVMPQVELLRGSGLSVFVDSLSIEYGEDWQKRLHGAISLCDRVMLFWTAAAEASEWVRKEWEFALSIGKTVVPTLLDFTPLPEPLARLHAVTALRRPPPRYAAPRIWRWLVTVSWVVLIVVPFVSQLSKYGVNSPPRPPRPPPAVIMGSHQESGTVIVPNPVPMPAPEEPPAMEFVLADHLLLLSTLVVFVLTLGAWAWSRRRSSTERLRLRLRSVVDEVYSA